MIDCHAHIGFFRGYDLSEETLMRSLQDFGVELALISNIDGADVPGRTRNLDETSTNEATADAVRRHPTYLRGLLWGRPGQGSPATLEPLLTELTEDTNWTERIFVGLKLHPEMNTFPADHGCVDPYMEFAARHKLPVVFHCDAVVDDASPERIARVATRHPNVGVVLYHMGFNGPHDAAIRVVEESLSRGDADLYLETSQVDPAVVLEAVGRVGAKRVLFGTDATYYGKDHYSAYRPLVEKLEDELSPEDLALILYENASSLFELT